MGQKFRSFRARCAVTVCGCALALAAHLAEAQDPDAVPAKSAFGDGSHLNYIRDVAQAQAAAYSKIVRSYDEHLEAEPRDAVAGVEKCLFIDQFADAEDNGVEEAANDQEKCIGELESVPMVNHAEAQLYLLDRQYGEKAISAAEEVLAASTSWPAPLRARLNEKLAFLYRNKDRNKAGMHALIAVQLDPQSKERVNAASWLLSTGSNERARALIASTPESAWASLSVYDAADVLIKVGDAAAAARLIRTHTQRYDSTYRKTALARALAEAGQIDIARQLYTSVLAARAPKLPIPALRDLFLFECHNGTQQQALTAYQRLREEGYRADPVGYYRFKLVERFPAAPWQWRDTAGPLVLIALLAFLALLPVVLIAPVHYRGLVHQLRGTLPPALPQPWGLSQAWYVLAGLLIAGVIACLFCAYSSLENLLGPTNGGSADQRALGNALIVQTILFALLAAPLLRRIDIRATLIGTWSLRKSLLSGIGWAVLARVVLSLGTRLVHSGRPAPAIGNLVDGGLQGIHAAYGAWAVLLVAAIAVPILEELAFRGVILTALRRYISFWPAALAQAVAFATMHEEVSLYLFFAGFGLATALLARRSQGLLASIAMHATNNLFAVVPLLGTP